MNNGYGNLWEVIPRSGISEKFFDVVLLKRCGSADRVR